MLTAANCKKFRLREPGNVSAKNGEVTKEYFVHRSFREMETKNRRSSLSAPQAVNHNPVNILYCVAPFMFFTLDRLSNYPICRK
jgi:hypothetical protein